ncbi:MAG: hypothetical protein L3J52_04640, partial [Proteobacteria bacterium]|nr:hypothetical protein [Pseudomonadota bacterium]
MKKIAILLIALVFANTMAQDMPVVVGPPGTEIIVSNLSISKSGIIISDGINISNSMGYDSQPEFSTDGKTLYFAKYINGQTDIYQHNFFYRNNTVYLKTAESEYSPT